MRWRTRASLLATATLLSLPQLSTAMGEDDPLISMVTVDKLELGLNEDPTPQRLEADAWLGYDFNKLWLKTEVEREGGETESANLEAFYSRAVAPYWDLQLGWRHDFKPGDSRDWVAVGMQGLAPYFFESDITAYVGEGGDSALEFSFEYELLFTQQLILSPEIEARFNGYNDPERLEGSGLSKVELGLRLRYEIRREIAPYIGLQWEKAFGNSADYARAHGEDIDELTAVIGVRAWF